MISNFSEAEAHQQRFLEAVQRLCAATREPDVGRAYHDVQQLLPDMPYVRLYYGIEIQRRIEEEYLPIKLTEEQLLKMAAHRDRSR